MTPAHFVYLHGTLVGRLEQGAGGLTLTYDRGWQERSDRLPLSLALPAVRHVHEAPGPEYFFDALLPDNADVRTRWGREWGVDGSDTLALLGAVGADLPGAVQVLRPDDDPEKQGRVAPLDKDGLRDLVRRLREDPTAWVADSELGAFSLAGAQRKIALVHEGNTWGRATGSTPTTHIVKVGTPGLAAQAAVEHFSLRVAHHLGLEVAASTLVPIDGESVIVVERFDRNRKDGRLVRLHQEDFCQALGRDPRKRYHAEGAPRAAEIARVLWQNTTEPSADVRRFASALVLQLLIGGTDAHARNYSIQHLDGGSRLAPLYDVATVLPYLPSGRSPRLAMAIGGETASSQITGEHLRTEERACRLPRGWLAGRIDELVDELPAAIEAALGDTIALPAEEPVIQRAAEALLEHGRATAERVEAI